MVREYASKMHRISYFTTQINILDNFPKKTNTFNPEQDVILYTYVYEEYFNKSDNFMTKISKAVRYFTTLNYRCCPDKNNLVKSGL